MSSLLYQSKPTTQILIPAGLSNFDQDAPSEHKVTICQTMGKAVPAPNTKRWMTGLAALVATPTTRETVSMMVVIIDDDSGDAE